MKLFTKLIFIFYTFIFISGELKAQRNCGTDEYHKQLCKDEKYLRSFLDTRLSIMKNTSVDRIACSNTIKIPMAFHFNGAVTSANMTCIMSQINAQIDILNKDFGGRNSDINKYCNFAAFCPTQFPPNALGNTACIEFCLATQNLPAGEADAITFGEYTFTTTATSKWAGYFNVFVSDVAPPGQSANLLGLAPLGGANNPNGNGMYIVASAFGGAGVCTSGTALNNSSAFNKGRTGTHEAGHYFGLKHVFEGCSNGDGIADTPDQSADNAGVPTVNTSNCTSTAINSCSTLDFFFNYMDYVDDIAMYMFTNNQDQVMNGYAAPQSKWATSTINCASNNSPTYPVGGCPAATAPSANFTNDYTGPLCAALAQVKYTDTSTGFPTSWSWTFSGAGVSPTSSTSQNPTVTYSSSGALTATLVATNSAGSSTKVVVTNVVIENPTNCGNCGQTFVDDGGAAANYPAANKTYTLCAGNVNEVLKLDFSQIAIETFQGSFATTDHIKVYNGSSATGTPVNYIFGSSIYTLAGSSLSAVGTTFIGTEQCATFAFTYTATPNAATFPGWTAAVTCIPKPTCNDGLQNQNETFVDCGGPCAPCPDLCDNFTFTDPGGASSPAGPIAYNYQICGTTAVDKVIVDFTSINMTPSNNGILKVYEGTSTSTAVAYYITSTQIFTLSGSTLTPFGNNTITSTGQCFTFQYYNGSNTTVGWEALVNCCKPAACPNSTNNGTPIVNAMVVTTCPGGSSWAPFTRDIEAENRACTTPSLEFKTYYKVKCDPNGGSLGIDISANTSGGNVQAGLFGPVTGSCPTYTGGSYVDCKDGTDPAPLTVANAAGGAEYIVVITSEKAGDFTINSTPGSTALPIELKYFTVKVKGNSDVQLNWATESEINNDGFTILRSNDGKSFEAVDFIKGKGNSSEEIKYAYLDENLLPQTYYYKLKQNDYDGTISYSEIVSVDVLGKDELKIFPNPAQSKVNIYSKSEIIDVKLVNLFGSIMNITVNKNGSLYDLNLTGIPAGVYYINLKTASKESQHQLIVIE